MRTFYVYILASKKNGTLYIGVTNNVARRVHEHRTGKGDSFTQRYGVFRLVYYEEHRTATVAIQTRNVAEAVATEVEDRVDREGQSRIGSISREDELVRSAHVTVMAWMAGSSPAMTGVGVTQISAPTDLR